MFKNIMDKKCVFLDRDGVINKSIVINKKPFSPRCKKTFEFLPNFDQSVERLKDSDFLFIIITNQPDISTGHISEDLLNYFHNRIKEKITLTDIFVCKDTAVENCSCRKPKPGMIFEAAKKHNINLKKSYFIGDRWKDVDASNQAGCHSIFIDYSYNEKLNTKPKNNVKSLSEAIDIILNNESRQKND